jgi:hypothetical protein
VARGASAEIPLNGLLLEFHGAGQAVPSGPLTVGWSSFYGPDETTMACYASRYDYFDGRLPAPLEAVRWLRFQTYAATAEACSLLSCAPPMGGIGPRNCFGCGTPLVTTFKIPAKLPSLHNHF